MRAIEWSHVWRYGLGAAIVIVGTAITVGAQGGQSPVSASGQGGQSPSPDVTYTKHIAPILQRSCENCHRSSGVAPMALSTYEEVRPWARAIKQRVTIGPHAGVMPPWYVEREIGIQKFKNDPSLTENEIAMVGRWVDAGAPRGQNSRLLPTGASRNGTSIVVPSTVARRSTSRVATADRGRNNRS